MSWAMPSTCTTLLKAMLVERVVLPMGIAFPMVTKFAIRHRTSAATAIATSAEPMDAINKASMDGYNSRMESMDHNQQQFTNYIKDEYTVANPNGQQYQVESGSNQYWMNNNGEYIPSNDVMYDPNADNAVNNQTWQEVEIVP